MTLRDLLIAWEKRRRFNWIVEYFNDFDSDVFLESAGDYSRFMEQEVESFSMLGDGMILRLVSSNGEEENV